MAGRLVNALGSSALAAEAFSDLATLRHMLRFEAALAQAAADAGLIPKKFAPIISRPATPRSTIPRRSPRRRAAPPP